MKMEKKILKNKIKKQKNKDLEEEIIKVLIRIAKTGEKEKGAIVVLGGNPDYQNLSKKNFIKPFYILDDLDLFENLCLMDGAVILDEKGWIKDYRVSLDRKKVLKGYGTRNAASLSASSEKDVKSVFMATATEAKVKIFKKGKLIMQIDALEKGIENKTSEIRDILESIGIGTLSTLGAGIVFPIVGITGIALLPGIIVFGSTTWLIKKFIDKK
jgi:DNA integrity scanning protein DisA with diadenylate cyclase activity